MSVKDKTKSMEERSTNIENPTPEQLKELEKRIELLIAHLTKHKPQEYEEEE